MRVPHASLEKIDSDERAKCLAGVRPQLWLSKIRSGD